jgi:hypothetical protein
VESASRLKKLDKQSRRRAVGVAEAELEEEQRDWVVRIIQTID